MWLQCRRVWIILYVIYMNMLYSIVTLYENIEYTFGNFNSPKSYK
jgi:hypothetical protein